MRQHRSSGNYVEETHVLDPKAERERRAAEMLDHLCLYASDGGGHLVDHHGGRNPASCVAQV